MIKSHCFTRYCDVFLFEHEYLLWLHTVCYGRNFLGKKFITSFMKLWKSKRGLCASPSLVHWLAWMQVWWASISSLLLTIFWYVLIISVKFFHFSFFKIEFTLNYSYIFFKKNSGYIRVPEEVQCGKSFWLDGVYIFAVSIHQHTFDFLQV